MRVLILQDYLRSGGTERQTVLLANDLAAEGHEATLLTFRPGGALAPTLAPLVGWRVLQPFDTGLDWFAPGLRRAVADIAPDAVLCMGRMANCHAGFLAKAFPALPVICSMRTGKKLPWLYRRSLRLAAHVVANSHEAAHVLAAQYAVPREKISVLHNAPVFETEEAADGGETTNAPRCPTLLCVAMFRPEKAHRELLDAVALLPCDREWRLVLAGDGPTRTACQRHAEKLGIADRVQFTGFVADPRPLHRDATVAVLASRSESLPNFLVEAHLRGVPSVACETGGVAECGGIVVPVGDTQRFADAVSKLLFDEPHRAAESQRVREYARQHFSREKQREGYRAVLEKITNCELRITNFGDEGSKPDTRAVGGQEHVILLHGMVCTPCWMNRMAAELQVRGFVTHNTGYASRTADIARLADDAIAPAIAECERLGAAKIHFVTHSMGGILVRSYLRRNRAPAALGRVVMLAPPNAGSEIVDAWLRLPVLSHFFRFVFGESGCELRAGAGSTPRALGAANFEVGILAGNRTWDLFHSTFVLPGENDGKVTVASSRLEGMRDHRTLAATHTFIIFKPITFWQTAFFLRHGRFAGK